MSDEVSMEPEDHDHSQSLFGLPPILRIPLRTLWSVVNKRSLLVSAPFIDRRLVKMMSSDPSASASASQPSVAQLRRPGTGPRRASKTVDLLQPFRRPVTMYNGQPDSENAQGGTLSQFLSMNKAAFFQAVTEGKGQEWTIVMGNEAGGEHSHSSILYSKC